MGLFRWHWLRSFVRTHSNPIEMTTAERWQQRLAVVYALVAWNAFGFVMYTAYNGKVDWDKINEEQKLSKDQNIAKLWAKSSGAKHGTAYKYKDGQFVTEKFVIEDEKDDNGVIDEKHS